MGVVDTFWLGLLVILATQLEKMLPLKIINPLVVKSLHSFTKNLLTSFQDYAFYSKLGYFLGIQF